MEMATTETNCSSFVSFMEQNGILPLWSELTHIESEW